MPNYQQIGDILGGMAAGLSGDAAGWQRNMMAREEMANQRAEREQEKAYVMQQRQQQAQQQEQERAVARMKTMFSDGAAAYKMAYANDWNGVVKLAQHRLEMSKHFPGADFSDTARIGELAARAAQGDQEAAHSAMGELQQLVDVGRAQGLIAPPEEKIVDGRRIINDPLTGKVQAVAIEGMPQQLRGQIVGDQYIEADERGKPVVSDVPGLRKDGYRAKDLELRQRQIELGEPAEKRQAEKVPKTVEDRLTKIAQDYVEISQQEAEFETLAADASRIKMPAGVKRSVTEFLKNVTGTQDAEVTETLRKYNKLRVGAAAAARAPGSGATSDYEMKLFMSTAPTKLASTEQMVAWANGAAKIAKLQKEFLQFSEEHLSEKKSGTNLLSEWNKYLKSKPKDTGSGDDALINKYLD